MLARTLSSVIVAALVCVLVALGTGGPSPSAGASTVGSTAACVTFPETGRQVCDRFLQYWQQNGGLAQQGLPLSDEFQEVSAVDGKTYTVQYFERAVFEKHPENAPPYDVLLTLLGREKFLAAYPNGPGSGPSAAPSPSQAPPAAWPRVVANATFRLTVHAVQDNVPGGAYFKPAPGTRWFAVDVSVTNLTTEPLYYSALRGRLKTTDNREWDQPIGGKEPDFKYGDQAPGSTVRGWITFEVATGAVPMTFTYNPKFDGKTQLAVDLR